MKRIATLLAAVAVATGLTLVTGPAHADEPVVCDAACVQAYEDEIAELTADRDWLAFKLMVANTQTASVQAKLDARETSLAYAYDANAALSAQLEDVRVESAARLARVGRLLDRVQALRAELHTHGF